MAVTGPRCWVHSKVRAWEHPTATDVMSCQDILDRPIIREQPPWPWPEGQQGHFRAGRQLKGNAYLPNESRSLTLGAPIRRTFARLHFAHCINVESMQERDSFVNLDSALDLSLTS